MTINNAKGPFISFAAGGDLSGSSLTTLTVTGIQGRKIKSGTPTDGQVLTWEASNNDWEAASPPAYISSSGPAVKQVVLDTVGGSSVNLTRASTNYIADPGTGTNATPIYSSTPLTGQLLFFGVKAAHSTNALGVATISNYILIIYDGTQWCQIGASI